MQETHAPLAPVDGQPPVPGATSYGLGWGVGTVNGTPVIVHDGQLRDFDTAAAILPEGKTAVVLLMNQDPELVVNDDSLYNGLMQGITTGRFPGYVPLMPTLLIFAAPDLAIWLYVIIAFFVVRAIVRAICISAGRGTPQPASP